MMYNNHIIAPSTNDRTLLKFIYRHYGTHVKSISIMYNIPEDKIKQDAHNGYLRFFKDNDNYIFNDEFLKRYCEAKGHLSQLKPYDFEVPVKQGNVYYGYYLLRLPQGTKQKNVFTYRLHSPFGDYKDFSANSYIDAFVEAKQYAFQNQLDNNIARRHRARLELTSDELYLLLSLLPPNKYPFTRKKLSLALDLIKTRKPQYNKTTNKEKDDGQ